MSTNYKLKGISEESKQTMEQTNREGGGHRRWREEVPVDVPAEGQLRFLRNAFKKMLPLLSEEKAKLSIAGVAIFFNSGLTLVAPLLVGLIVDNYIQTKDMHGLLVYSGILLGVYAAAFVANLIQMRTMSAVGQRTLFRLRNALFTKLQELPVAFFNQNRAGDLISRLNNDTDKLNQFFSQVLMQLTNNLFVVIGAGIFVLVISWKLGLAALAPVAGLLIFTELAGAWMKRVNLVSLQAEGAMSGQINESMSNFKVILAFNRRDYFRERFTKANYLNFLTSVKAGLANNLLSPLYDFAGNLAQLIVLVYGIFLILHGQLEVGLLISFLLYVANFYNPLRQMAQLWASIQVSLAGWDRISEILSLESNLKVLPSGEVSSVAGAAATKATGASSADIAKTGTIMEFRDVSFHYPDGKEVLHRINFAMEKGKTYALVGPTGGGKTTTASIIARLYDPTKGTVLLDGRDIRSYQLAERTAKIGFILQEPFLFSGTVRDNILYGNTKYFIDGKFDAKLAAEKLVAELKSAGLESLMARFENGLDTQVSGSGDTISLGQRQLIAFIRAVLRQPDILILDEATANIDTVTEQLLQEILRKLPAQTTRIIIAHRLNTIENADEIFFVNAGEVTPAGSFQQAVDMLLHDKRAS